MTFIEFEPIIDFENLNNAASQSFDKSKVQNTEKCNSLNPKIDISEDEKNIYLEMEIPGIKKEDLKITIENKKLTITGEKKNNTDSNDKRKFLSRERVFGPFQKIFTIEHEINRENINADFENGILTITIEKLVPKKQEWEIEIK